MKTLTLLKDNGLIREYQLTDGRCIKIDVSEEFEIRIRDIQENEIGKFEISYYDDDLPGQQLFYHIKWMYMDLIDTSYKHQGIGREALKFFKEVYDTPIKASENNGIRKEDGSHLTADAPYFVEKMKNEGIIV